MAGKEIAVKATNWMTQFKLTPPAAVPASVQFSVSSQASSKVKCGGIAAWLSPIVFSISGYADGTSIDVPGSGATTAPGKIDGSAANTTIEGKPAVLKGDKVTVTVTGQKVSGNTTVPATCNVTVEIQDAGQTKVKGS